MKKSLIVVIGLAIIFSAPNLFANTIQYLLTDSNVLPNGQIVPPYGWVNLTLLTPSSTPTTACPGSYDGVQIVADPNNAKFTTTGTNFGIQKFGFNYAGNPQNLTLVNLPAGWTVTTGNVDGFGVFMEVPTGPGNTSQDPLVFEVCNNSMDLSIEEVAVKNADGHAFVAHIIDFTYAGYTGTNSAFFAECPDCSGVTAINLSSFTPKAGNNKVTLTWETATEIDNAGFNIYRSDSADGDYQKVNAALIPAQGSATEGAAYGFTDTDAKNRKTYFYKLEDVDLNGASTMHGPVSATPVEQPISATPIPIVQPIQVSVDIKPGACPNPIGKTGDKAVMSFAIMGTVSGFDIMGTVEDFDVTQIDPESILITREGVADGVAPIRNRWNYSDVATPFEGELCDCHGLQGDGIMDLSMKVYVKDVVDVLRLQEVAEETIPLTVTGKLYDEFGGTPIEGKDCVRVLKSVLKEKK